MPQRDIIAHLARFADALRERGIEVVISDEIDAATALTLVDLRDPEEVRLGLRSALKVEVRNWGSFDELFHLFWIKQQQPAPPVDARTRPATDRSMPRFQSPAWQGVERRPRRPRRPSDAGDRGESGRFAGYSPEALLRHKPFDEWSKQNLAEMDRLLVRLARKLATKRSRRLVPVPGRGIADLRRSFRRAVGTGGDFLSLARRARQTERPKLVLVCDTSGSMDPYTRFLLAFVLSLKRVARSTEIFAFNTELTRITTWISAGNIRRTLDRLAAGVPDWSGGTRIGECLLEFVSRYMTEVVDTKTVVVILSDGLDRGDTASLVRALTAIRAKARKLIWLNPLLGDPRYEPTARGMAAALPLVNLFAPAHNLESLERLIPSLAV